jgi:hypothetical protein
MSKNDKKAQKSKGKTRVAPVAKAGKRSGKAGHRNVGAGILTLKNVVGALAPNARITVSCDERCDACAKAVAGLCPLFLSTTVIDKS